jgi:hypothetical protein
LEQLQELLRLRRITDDSHNLRVVLWLEGYAVPLEKIWESLCAGLIRGMGPLLDAARQEPVAKSEDYPDELAVAAENRTRGSELGALMRDRLPRKVDRQAALLAMFTFMRGEDMETGAPLLDVVRRLLGLDQLPFSAPDDALEDLLRSGLLLASAIEASLHRARPDEIEAMKPDISSGFDLRMLSLISSGKSTEWASNRVTRDAASLAATIVGLLLHASASGFAAGISTFSDTARESTTSG